MSNYDDLPLKERMKPFLLNEDMADIHFVVGVDPHKVSTLLVGPGC